MQKSKVKSQNYNSKLKSLKTLKRAIDFHGHLGPYLVLGVLAGELALKELGCKKYFGLDVKVWGADRKPKSCLIDGLQLSTGATYGKGNIHKLNSGSIKVLFRNLGNNRKIKMTLNRNLIDRLGVLKGHIDSEDFAKKLLAINPRKLFGINF